MASLYLDHNASTPVDPKVLEAMEPWLRGSGANPSSSHEPGRMARHAIDKARRQVAKGLRCSEEQVLFTASGTEANNLAILGSLRGRPGAGLLTCAAEHSSVLGPADRLASEGFPVEVAPVDEHGRVGAEALTARLRPETRLVSLMLANNEVGTLEPVAEVARTLPEGVLLHCDAVQAVGKVEVDFDRLGADLLSVSAHKFYGPPGAGALVVRRGADLDPLQFGGDQERGLRPGTEDVPAIVGLGRAIELATERLPRYQETIAPLAARLRALLADEVPSCRMNTPERGALPNTLNVSFPGIDGRALLIQLDLEGIAVSLGSACASGSILPSHVLLAMGRTRQEALSSIRFSLGWGVTAAEVEHVGRIAGEIARKIQKTQEGG